MQLATIDVAGVSLVETQTTRLNKLLGHFETIKSSANDEILSKSITAYSATLEAFKNDRMPLTRKFDEIKSQFTALEKQIETCITHCKTERNRLATEALKAQEEARRKADEERRKTEAIIKAKHDVRVAIRNFMIEEAQKMQIGIVKGIASVTEANYEKKLEGLKSLPTFMTPEKYYTFSFPGLDKKFVDEALDELKEEVWNSYQKSIEEIKQEAIIDMANFKEISKEARKEYVKESVKEIENLADQAKEVSEVTEDMRKDVASQEVAFASIGNDPEELKNVKQSYIINVENKAAYKSCVAYWFETFFPEFEGQILTKTVGSMITDLERHANQTGIFMKTPGVSYENKVTVINRK